MPSEENKHQYIETTCPKCGESALKWSANWIYWVMCYHCGNVQIDKRKENDGKAKSDTYQHSDSGCLPAFIGERTRK